MGLPDVKSVIINGGLGLAVPKQDGIFAIVGTALQGEINKPLVFGNITDVKDTFGVIEIDADYLPNNALVSAAECAFQNGAGRLWLVRAENDTNEKLTLAVDSLTENDDIRGVYVADPVTSIFATALQAKADAWFNKHRPSFFVVEAKFVPDANAPAEVIKDSNSFITAILEDFKSLSADFVSVCAGFMYYSDGSGRKWIGRTGAALMGILAKSPVSRSAGFVRYNSIVNSLGLAPHTAYSEEESAYLVGDAAFNETQIETLDSKQLVTSRSITGISGFYITYDNTFAPLGSDFRAIRTVRTMFKAIRESRSAMLPNLLADFPASGPDLEIAMKDLESQGIVPLNRMKAAKEITEAVVTIPLDQDFLGTETIIVDLSIVPRIAARTISLRFGLKNPALNK